ncbi:MAG TPA: site-specific DNA-methyltransferase [Candidatus Aquilonibacter sp.]|nr:site-specific DNA-methyltransferase [Candidatus Aquilonibacter sp.]
MATGIPKSKTNGSVENRHDQRTSGQFNLDYEGKRTASEIIADCPKAKLTVAQPPRHSQGWANRLYFGDNVEILGTLLDDSAVRGQVSLVYIDPPYSTNSVFESREQKIAYHDLLSGSAFVEFLRERLVLLRELLSARGSIYVHLDENMAFPMKIVMDEVFGAANFRNFITRKKCNTKNYTRRTYGNISDYILFYSKTETYIWNRPVIAWSEETAKKEYTYEEASTGRRFKKVPIHAPGIRNGETGKPWRGVLPPPGKHWQFPPSVLEEMDRRGEIFWSSNGNPRRKIYLDDSNGIPVQDIWLDFKDAHNQNIEITGYPTEKNIEMLEQIISASSNPGDLVLDCFAGSGTTLIAAGNLGRRWIGIDNSNEAIGAIVNRLRFGSRPMGDYVTKKRKTVAENHLELFGSNTNTNVEQETTTNGIAENFCLYRTANTLEFESQPNVVALRDKPAKWKLPQHPQKIVYRIPRKRSSGKKNAK